MIYFFKIGDRPAVAHEVELGGFIADGAQTMLHYNTMASKMAKMLHTITGSPIKFYPQDKPGDCQTIDTIDEGLTSEKS